MAATKVDRPGITITRLWAFLAVGLPVLAAFIAGLSTVDLAYHLRAGGELLDTGRISTTDTWTFTAAGAPWLNQQWGAQAALTFVYRVAGWTGLALLRATLVGLTFAFVFETCRRGGLDHRRAAWLTLAAFVVSAVALALRPQLFGMALAALTLLLVTDRGVHPGRIWLVPIIVAVWANVHGSFFLGPLILGLAWLEDLHDRVEQRNRMLVVAVVAALATLANPFGVGVWGYAAGLSTNGFVTSRISEWQPTTLRTVPGILFFASVAAVTLILIRRGKAVPWTTYAWLLTFFAIGGYAIRGVAWWPLGAVAAVLPLLAPQPAEPADAKDAEAGPRPEHRRPVNLVVVGLIVLACVALMPAWRQTDPTTRAPAGLVGDAPSGITAALREAAHPGDRILNPQPWGSWFELALPDNPVATDSRIEIYPADVWAEFDAVRSGIGDWQGWLAAHDVKLAVVQKDEMAFLERLKAAGWRVVWVDDDGAVLARTP